MTQRTLYVAMRTNQSEIGIPIVVEQGALPFQNGVAPRAVRSGAHGELSCMNVFVATRALLGRRAVINKPHRRGRDRRLVALLAGRRAVRSDESERSRGMIETG